MDTRVVALDSDVILALFRAEQYGYPNGLDAIVGQGRLVAITSTVRAEVAALPTIYPETDGRIDAWIEQQKLLGNLKVYNTQDFLPGENRGEQSILSALSQMQSDGSGGAVQVFSNDADARAFFDASPLADTFDTQTGLLVSWIEGALTMEEYYSLSVAVAPEAGPPRFEPFSGEVWNSSDGHSVRILPTGQILVVDAAGRTFVIESNEHVRFNSDGTVSRPDGTGIDENLCFLAGTEIDMWPLDPGLRPGAETKLTIGTDNSKSIDATLIRSIAKAHQYYDAIKNGQTFEEIAASENLSKRRIMQVIDLAFLAPDVVKLIVQGDQPLGLTAKWLGINPMPSDWQAQRRIVAAL